MSDVTLGEIRTWAYGLGFDLPSSGGFPQALLDRWNREHPDRPYYHRTGRPGFRPFIPKNPTDATKASSAAARRRRASS